MARVRGLRLVLRLLFAVGLALLVLEGGLRWVLFSEAARARDLGWQLRRPELYGLYESGREFWQLRAALGVESGLGPAAEFDARLGWRNRFFDGETLEHVDEVALGARRPVLLFGDSNARCVEPPEDCWEGLLARSSLGETHALLNYGVGGYGFDQAALLMRHALPRFLERDPVVVIGILVDDDLDRCWLALRDGPKPSFSLAGDALVLEPPAPSAAEFLARRPLAIRSYLVRLLAVGGGLVSRERVLAWAGESEHVAEKKALARALVLDLERELTARGVEHFFVLFNALPSLTRSGEGQWEEPFLRALFAEHGIPFVSSRSPLERHFAASRSDPRELFHADGIGSNHYTAAANALVFPALAKGLAGRFER
jgi:hypothetical protein